MENKISHYFNNIDGLDIDATASQFDQKPKLTDVSIVSIDRILCNEDTNQRFNLLKQRYTEKYSGKLEYLKDYYKSNKAIDDVEEVALVKKDTEGSRDLNEFAN